MINQRNNHQLKLTILTLFLGMCWLAFTAANVNACGSRYLGSCTTPTPRPPEPEIRAPSAGGIGKGSVVTPDAFRPSTVVRINPNTVRDRASGLQPMPRSNLARASDISPHVRSSMTRRGWDEQSVLNTVNNPSHTSPTTMNNGANGTAFFRPDNHYVVRNNESRMIWAVSDATKPISLTAKPNHFTIDSRVKNPPAGLGK